MLFIFRKLRRSFFLPGKVRTYIAYCAGKSPAIRYITAIAWFIILPGYAIAQVVDLQNSEALHLHKVFVETATHEGRTALRVTETEKFRDTSPDKLVVIKGIDFQNGVIEVDVAGRPYTGANERARGFIGVAFHVNADVSKYECIYLRPTNGRANDQLRRNHSTQYISYPDYTWQRLRESMPGKYEAYVDLVTGQWTQIRIEVSGTTARLFVHGAEQPTLIVNDLKLGEISGAIALRIGPGTEGYFSNLRVLTDK
ncbi:MAG: hypothetical protein O7C75_07860 [Verrucomicrobia bacterium]|nr:hypothetical protein [Verrucomicrobiota bacterium]